jgi:hypothetical protein
VSKKRPILVETKTGRVRTTRLMKATGLTVESLNVTSKCPESYPNGLQVTASENHPSWRSRKGRATSDIGGEFSSTKTSVTWNNSVHRLSKTTERSASWDTTVYTGPILAVSGSPAFPPAISSNELTLDAWGAKAVANAKPTNALVDLSTTLGEMIGPGGLPRMIGRAAFWHEGIVDALKQSAGDFLNVQFSLTPIVQDMVGFANVVTRFTDLIRQYERDAGKVVRRRWSFEPITTEVNTEVAAGVAPYMAPSNSNFTLGVSGKVLRRRETSINRWFSGAFTYHLPTGYSARGSVMDFGPEAQRMLGLELTPETLWNLAPWSWAVDWFSSAGDVVSNISDWSNDGLVMRYGYLMEHCVSRDIYYWTGSGFQSNAHPSPVTLTRESKLRRRANPFGFGLTWGGLSPRQLAIAASLGISRW